MTPFTFMFSFSKVAKGLDLERLVTFFVELIFGPRPEFHDIILKPKKKSEKNREGRFFVARV